MHTPSSQNQSTFATTRWTQVLSARGDSPEGKVALGELCEAYWTPVLRFIQRNGYNEDAARDLTQEFFVQLLAHNGIKAVEPGKGHFRSYLLGAVKHFLADQFDCANAAKRGGGQVLIPIDADASTEAPMEIPDPKKPGPGCLFRPPMGAQCHRPRLKMSGI